jgi:hypothetical protein
MAGDAGHWVFCCLVMLLPPRTSPSTISLRAGACGLAAGPGMLVVAP